MLSKSSGGGSSSKHRKETEEERRIRKEKERKEAAKVKEEIRDDEESSQVKSLTQFSPIEIIVSTREGLLTAWHKNDPARIAICVLTSAL